MARPLIDPTERARTVRLQCAATANAFFGELGRGFLEVGEGIIRILHSAFANARIYPYKCVDQGRLTTMRIADAESGVKGSAFSCAGFIRASLRWDAQVGVLQVHWHNEVAFSAGVQFAELIAAHFSMIRSCVPSDRRVYLTLGYLKVMTEVEALYGDMMVWHKDRLAPGGTSTARRQSVGVDVLAVPAGRRRGGLRVIRRKATRPAFSRLR